jgi:hypothetical protein
MGSPSGGAGRLDRGGYQGYVGERGGVEKLNSFLGFLKKIPPE